MKLQTRRRRLLETKDFSNQPTNLRILFLIPHPFYQDRGSPIADDMILKVLSQRGHKIDVVTYSEGINIRYEKTRFHRTPKIPLVGNIRPGFSWKKVICDLLMFLKVLRLVSRKQYHLVHAVEETVFIALLLKVLFKIDYVYDMDSSLAQQIVEKYSWLSPLIFILNFFERIAIKNAKCVIPVCQALAKDILVYQPRKVAILPDVSLLKPHEEQSLNDLKSTLKISGLMLMYVGNLESYQGIDLLLESCAIAFNKTNQFDLVIVGGETADIQKYQKKAKKLGFDRRIHFLGAKPARELGGYLSQADILVSPRVKGKNTPMKIYSYLDSGKPVLATNLLTHTQVLDDQVAMLAAPTPEAFAEAILSLVSNRSLRLKLGISGKLLIQKHYTYAAFSQKLNSLYDWLTGEILANPLQTGY